LEPKSGGENLIGRQKPDIFDLGEMSNVFRGPEKVENWTNVVGFGRLT